MSASALASTAHPALRLPGWVLATGLIVLSCAVGPTVGAIMRPVFILACGAVGLYAWRQGPAEHLKAMLVLFCFASLARRMVDLTAGFDTSSTMLVGPPLALMAAALELPKLTEGRAFANTQIGPVAVVSGTILYAVFNSVFQGDWTNAITGAIKSIVPLIYVASLLLKGFDPDEMVEAAASAFLIILPVMGLYGIYQYVDPPYWDRLWMASASILSAGQPIPFGVRTFSTLNGPASFATFTAAGLMLVLFLRTGPLAILLALPAAIAFLLSMYRTGWLSLAAGIGFCLLFRSTQNRAAVTIVSIIGMVAIAMLTPFGDVISDRLSTLGQGSQDGSARERLEQFAALWSRPDSGLYGAGFSTVDVGSAGSMPVDGMFIICWISMGLVVGMICIAGLLYAAGSAIVAAGQAGTRHAVVVGGLACGALIQLPLANLISGELGFLFWTFVVLVPMRYVSMGAIRR